MIDSCCCEDTHIAWHRGQVRKGVLLEYLSLGWMSIEVVASLIAGLVIGRSFALLAFGGDSVIELISAYAVLGHLKGLDSGASTIGAESERTEKISTSLLILLIPVIVGGAVFSYFSGIKPEASPLGIAVAIGAVIIMPVLWTKKRRVGIDCNMPPLKVDAIESATCLFMAVALLCGLLINFFLHITWSDYFSTAMILGFISLEIKESIEEIRK